MTLSLILVAFLIGVFGLGQPVGWLFLPLTILAVRTSRPATVPAPGVGAFAGSAPSTTLTQPSR
jgi:hypothetical protein